MINRILTIVAVICGLTAMAADKPKIELAETKYDFGTIHESNGPVTHSFEFTNTGDAPLVIISMTNGGCGCTTPSFPKQPIMPGEKGVLKITFNPENRRGEFFRTVKVRTNASSRRLSLSFKGVIVP